MQVCIADFNTVRDWVRVCVLWDSQRKTYTVRKKIVSLPRNVQYMDFRKCLDFAPIR